MKQIFLALAFLSLSIFIKAQTISLGTDNEYCPNTEYEFTVTLPSAYTFILYVDSQHYYSFGVFFKMV
jgi:hypothetical protein